MKQSDTAAGSTTPSLFFPRVHVWLLLFGVWGWSGSVADHQPHVIGTQTETPVVEPEISKAYYAELMGHPARFHFTAQNEFALYLQLLVPHIDGATTDYRARILRDGQVFAELHPQRVTWRTYHEHFGGDVYLLGPEFRAPAPAGHYQIEVTSPENRGKYILAIGEKEAFAPGEILQTMGELFAVKRYFGKPAYSVKQSPFFYVPTAIAFLAAAGIVVVMVRRRNPD
jgi:hypothetical protein